VNNASKEAQIMGIEKLDAEKSTNFTVGMGLRPFENFSLTVDYYDIKVEDRIVLSNELDASSIPALSDLFSVSFFSNAIDTRTSGIDVVGSYGGLGLGKGTMRFNFAANFQTKNEREGSIRNPEFADNTGQEVIDDTQEALLFTSRPKFKAILGADYTIGKFNFALNGTVFGPTEFRNAGMSSDLKVEFKTKLVTDLAVTFNATEKLTVALNINNIFNVLPEWKFVALNQNGRDLLNDTTPVPGYFTLTPKEVESNLITFNQRYPIVTYDGSHFSQLGTILNFAVSLKL
jgi:iron complex outermembrane receptor protein